MNYHIEKECFRCEMNFTVLVDDVYDVEFCPFCGGELEDDYSDLDNEDSDD